MKIEEVKKSLNKMVTYKEKAGIYRFTGCILRRNAKGFFYEAELLDTINGNSIAICKLDDIEVTESDGKRVS